MELKIKQVVQIKTAYKYYDESLEVWNLFLFVELFSLSFCIQRIRKNIDRFVNFNDDDGLNNEMYSPTNIVYIFENNNLVAESIKNLKMYFGKKLKKISINKTMANTSKCISCYSCNFFIYLLGCAYVENPENIITNGIYAKYSKIFRDDNDIETLENSLEYQKKNILYGTKDLTNKISEYINSKYNNKIFYSDENLQDCSNYCCDIEGCKFTSVFDNPDLFFCQDCLLYKTSYGTNEIYNLCKEHINDKCINEHIFSMHSDINNCKFVNWNDELKSSEESIRIKKFIKCANG